MKKNRRWTVIIVPHGSAAPRTIAVTERVLRAVGTAVATCAVVAVVGVGTVASRSMWASYTGAVGNVATLGGAELDEITARIARMRDTLAVIREREAQIRALAGMPGTDSGTLADSAAASADSLALLRDHADSLLRHADQLSARFAAVSDSLARSAEKRASAPPRPNK